MQHFTILFNSLRTMRVRILRGQQLMFEIFHMLPERGNVRSEDNLIVDRQRLEDGLNVLGKVGGIFRHDAVCRLC